MAQLKGKQLVDRSVLPDKLKRLPWKAAVRAATTANISLVAAPAAVDGVTLSAGERVLIKDQTDQTENGIYQFNGTGVAMTRTTDADSAAELNVATVGVVEGTVNQGVAFTQTVPNIVGGVIWETTDAGGAHIAAIDPTINDDTTKGFDSGDLWLNTTTEKLWQCLDTSAGAAVWWPVTSVQSQIIHVGKHGDDSYDGKSIERAKLTFGAAITAAGTPADEANAVTVGCSDDGEYSEYITLPSFVNIHAPRATIKGKLTIAGSSRITLSRLLNGPSTTSVIVDKQSGSASDMVFLDVGEIVNDTIEPSTSDLAVIAYGTFYLRAHRLVQAEGDGILFLSGSADAVALYLDVGEWDVGTANVGGNPTGLMTGQLPGAYGTATTYGRIGSMIGGAASKCIELDTIGGGEVYLSVGLLTSPLYAYSASDGTLRLFVGELSGAEVVSSPGNVRVTKAQRNNYTATAAPTVNDDSADGYTVGSTWINVTTDKAYVCLDATAASAVWTETTQDVVGADHGALSGLADDDHTQYHTDARGDARYYTETELDAGQLDNRYYTETELDAGQLDNRYYTETEIDATFMPLAGGTFTGVVNHETAINMTGTVADSVISFNGVDGGSNGGIQYVDLGSVPRYAFFFPGQNLVVVGNRAQLGVVQIRANNGPGTGGEVTVAQFEYDVINFYVNVLMEGTDQIQFGDAGQYIHESAPTVLSYVTAGRHEFTGGPVRIGSGTPGRAISEGELYVAHDLEVEGNVFAENGQVNIKAATAAPVCFVSFYEVSAFHGVLNANFLHDQLTFGVGSGIGRQLVLCESTVYAQDFDHAVQTNPTFYVQSVTPPNDDNTQWWSIAHLQTHALYSVGVGWHQFDANILMDGAAAVQFRQADTYWSSDAAGYLTGHVPDDDKGFEFYSGANLLVTISRVSGAAAAYVMYDNTLGHYFATGGTLHFEVTATEIHNKLLTRFQSGAFLHMQGDLSGSAYAIYCGVDGDALIGYDGANFILDPSIVGTGKVYVGPTANKDIWCGNARVSGAGKIEYRDTAIFTASLNDGYMDHVADLGVRFSGVSGTPKAMVTPIGGRAIRLTNDTGAASVKGELVQASTGADDAFQLCPGAGNDAMGVIYEDGIANGQECWVVESGIADVALENETLSTHGNWAGMSATAGRADMTGASPPAAPGHFKEVGHCIETKVAGAAGVKVLARMVVHFN